MQRLLSEISMPNPPLSKMQRLKKAKPTELNAAFKSRKTEVVSLGTVLIVKDLECFQKVEMNKIMITP